MKDKRPQEIQADINCTLKMMEDLFFLFSCELRRWREQGIESPTRLGRLKAMMGNELLPTSENARKWGGAVRMIKSWNESDA